MLSFLHIRKAIFSQRFLHFGQICSKTIKINLTIYIVNLFFFVIFALFPI